MAKYGSPSALYLVDGYNLLSSKFQSMTRKVSSAMEDTHGLGDSATYKTPVGVRTVEVTQQGAFFDDSAGLIHAQFSGATDGPTTTARVVCAGLAGNTSGALFYGVEGVFAEGYDVLANIGKLSKSNLSLSVKGQLDDGVVLHPLGAETVASGNTQVSYVDNSAIAATRAVPITSSSVASPSIITCSCQHGLTSGDTVVIAGHSGSTPSINGEQTATVISTTTFSIPVNVTVGGTGGTFTRAQTSNGGHAYLQVTGLALGGYTDCLITIRESADHSIWSDLGAFSAVTLANTAQRVAIVGAVDRYLAVSWLFEGAGSGQSITFFAGLARS